MNKKNKASGSSKKELRATLTEQLYQALAGFKEAVHEKKLQKLVKKAAKLLADGLHHNKPASSVVNKKSAPKKDLPGKQVPKKVIKKAAPKKAASKKATKKK